MVKLSVLIPVFNAEKTIGLLCNSLIALYAQRYALQIVLVNDGSRDGSDQVCRSAQQAAPAVVTYVRLSKNFGEHNAVMAGLQYVTGDYCVIMDDDLQNPPEEVERLLAEIRKGYDVVYTFYPSKKYGLFRRLGSSFSDKVANIVLRKPRHLYLSSFKAINRFLVREIRRYEGPAPYIDGLILRTTDNIGKLSVEHRARSAERSGYTLKKLVSLWGSMVVNYSMMPLRLAGFIGTLLVLYSIAYGLYKANDSYYGAGQLSEYEMLMAANLFFRGLVLLAVSVLGEYVGRIYFAVSREPQYVVREAISERRQPAKIEYIGTAAAGERHRRCDEARPDAESPDAS